MKSIKNWLTKYGYEFKEGTTIYDTELLTVFAGTDEKFYKLMNYLDRHHKEMKVSANHFTKKYMIYKQ